MTSVAVQDSYPPDVAVCYGCGRLNDDGLHIRTFWDGAQVVATFQPKPYHLAITGVVYGGLLASLLRRGDIGMPPPPVPADDEGDTAPRDADAAAYEKAAALTV